MNYKQGLKGDTVNNAIAVCPNCHRELHFGSKEK
jgi:predicted HNH restriction endonuclease